jgi:hypothetical protein
MSHIPGNKPVNLHDKFNADKIPAALDEAENHGVIN